MFQGGGSEGWKPAQLQGEKKKQHQAEPEPGDRREHKRHDHTDMVQYRILPDRRQNPQRHADHGRDDHGKYRKQKGIRKSGNDVVNHRLPAAVGNSKIKMENNVPDISKETDQKRLVIAKLGIQGRDILRLCRNSQNNGSRIARGQRQYGENQKSYAQKNRNHVKDSF